MGTLIVGMGEVAIGYESDTIGCLGLGSCVAVVLYDAKHKIGGIAHVMLPEAGTPPISGTILLAEHQISSRDQLRRILSARHQIVGETWDKDKTLESFKTLRPSVTIINTHLPPTGGIDVIGGLHCIDKAAQTVSVASVPERSVIDNCMAAGALEVITGPLRELTVFAAIDAILNTRDLRYADRAVTVLIGKMVNRGADVSEITAKLAGGAHVFATLSETDLMRIGARNIDSVKKMLALHKIRIIAEDLGKNCGRTVYFDVSTGMLAIKTKEGNTIL